MRKPMAQGRCAWIRSVGLSPDAGERRNEVPHGYHERVGRWPLLLVFIQLIRLLGGGAILHAQTPPLGNISTFAGQCNSTGSTGDGGAATSAKLGNLLQGLAVDAAGNVYIADAQNHRIRKVDT